VQVVLAVGIYLLFADVLPMDLQRGFYTISLLIKDILVWTMPLTVCAFVASTVHSFGKRAMFFVIILVLFETISNFSSVWYAFFVVKIASSSILSFDAVSSGGDFSALWRLPFVKSYWWSPDKGVMVGVILGLVAVFKGGRGMSSFINTCSDAAKWMLTKVFVRLAPIFILGFVVQMHQKQLIQHLIANYAVLIGWLVMFLLSYIIFLFAIGAGLRLEATVRHIKHLLPAGFVALTTGCSMSTMPWTIACTEKNLHDPALAKAIIPATTNIQQIGDCIVNSFLCFVIYQNFYGSSPDATMWLVFSVMFVISRFATAAVMGGAIFIMLPIYESYLNFTPEMIAIILAFNVVLDPLVTSSNVLANGALCRVFEMVWSAAGGAPKIR
jgi:Na+/H+-dicarboxylate symporter